MMMRKKRPLNLRPLLLKFGVAGSALSFAGFLYSQIRSRSLPVSDGVIEADMGGRDGCKDDEQGLKISPTSDSEEKCMQQSTVDSYCVDRFSSIRYDAEDFLLPEYNDVVEECDLSVTGAGSSTTSEVETPMVDVDVDTSRTFRNSEKDDYEQEIKHLKNMVNMLRDRVSNLEVQLLEYYGLKEQEAAVLELRNRLKVNNMEMKLFTLKIESLRLENQRLKDQVADHAKIVADLEAARLKIKLLDNKLRNETEQKREQILSLQQRVARLQEEEHDVESKLQRLQVLESEAEKLRNSNRILQIENSELAQKLESTKILENSVSENPKLHSLFLSETINEVKQENEGLRKQIEELQTNRCADIEELVYLRWINACLRYELRNFRPPTGKTIARDLSRSLSPTSEEKAKKLIREYAQTEGMGNRWMHSLDFDCEQWSSSSQSSATDTGELGLDDPSFDNTSTTKSNSSGKKKIFSNLRRILTGKHSRHHSQASTTSKTDQTDVDSLIWAPSTGSDPLAMVMLRSNSERVAAQSPDVPTRRGRSMSVDQIKVAENLRRNCDCDSHSHRCRSDESDSLKSDLMKFAQVLEESKPRKAHRKSASII